MPDNELLDLPDSNPFFEGDPLAAPAQPEVSSETVVVGADPLEATASEATSTEKPTQAGVPRKVVEKLRRDRSEARDLAADLQERLVVAEAQARTARDIAQVLHGVSPERAAWDHNYLNALEALSQRDPAFAKLAQQVIAAMEDSPLSNDSDALPFAPTYAAEDAPAQVASDPRVEALYEREAASHVKASLDGLTPEFQAIFANLVLGNSEDPLSMSRHEIREVVAGYAQENGFKPEQYLAAPEARRPMTQASGSRAVPAPGPAVGTDGKPLPLAKSMQEWAENRQARMRQLLGS